VKLVHTAELLVPAASLDGEEASSEGANCLTLRQYVREPTAVAAAMALVQHFHSEERADQREITSTYIIWRGNFAFAIYRAYLDLNSDRFTEVSGRIGGQAHRAMCHVDITVRRRTHLIPLHLSACSSSSLSPQLADAISLVCMTSLHRVYRLYHARHRAFFVLLLTAIRVQKISYRQCGNAADLMHVEIERIAHKFNEPKIDEDEEARWLATFLRHAKEGKPAKRARPPPAAPEEAVEQSSREQPKSGRAGSRIGVSKSANEPDDDIDADTEEVGAEERPVEDEGAPSHHPRNGLKAKCQQSRSAESEPPATWATEMSDLRADLAAARQALYGSAVSPTLDPAIVAGVALPIQWLRVYAPFGFNEQGSCAVVGRGLLTSRQPLYFPTPRGPTQVLVAEEGEVLCFYKQTYIVGGEMGACLDELAVVRRMMAQTPPSSYLPRMLGLAGMCVTVNAGETSEVLKSRRCGLIQLCVVSELLRGINAFLWLMMQPLKPLALLSVPASTRLRAASPTEAVPSVPMQARIELAIEFVRAVRHLHSLGIVHRDISAANVMLSQRPAPADENADDEEQKQSEPAPPPPPRVTLIDFNISLVVGVDDADRTAPIEGVAAEALQAARDFSIGTPEYHRQTFLKAKVKSDAVGAALWRTLPRPYATAAEYWREYDHYAVALVVLDFLRGVPIRIKSSTSCATARAYIAWAQGFLEQNYTSAVVNAESSVRSPPSIVSFLFTLRTHAPSSHDMFSLTFLRGNERVATLFKSNHSLCNTLHYMTTEGWTNGRQDLLAPAIPSLKALEDELVRARDAPSLVDELLPPLLTERTLPLPDEMRFAVRGILSSHVLNGRLYWQAMSQCIAENPRLAIGAKVEIRALGVGFSKLGEPCQLGLFLTEDHPKGAIVFYGGIRRHTDDYGRGEHVGKENTEREKSHSRSIPGTSFALDGRPFADMCARVIPLTQAALDALPSLPASTFLPCGSYGVEAIHRWRHAPKGFMANCPNERDDPTCKLVKHSVLGVQGIEGECQVLEALAPMQANQQIYTHYNNNESREWKHK
jgi:serine/threonine protein kinase